MIKKIGKNKWAVFTEDGTKRLGTHPSQEAAIRQLMAIEISKHAKSGKK